MFGNSLLLITRNSRFEVFGKSLKNTVAVDNLPNVMFSMLAQIASALGFFSIVVDASCKFACQQLSESPFGPVFHGQAARLDLWSNFQAESTPICRVQPSDANDVAGILSIARANQCHFAILAGGTSPFKYASNADGGITVDMARMNSVEIVDPEAESLNVKVGAGSLWADVYRELDLRNLSATGTRNSLSGVVGSVLGGGISFFSQHHGWACDTVSNYEIVLANSSIVNISHSSHPDIFFVLRGGGNNFGIITSLVIEAFRDPPTWYTFQLWDMKILGTIFWRLENHTNYMPEEVTQIAVTLGWHIPTQNFVISERMVASRLPFLSAALPFPDKTEHEDFSPALATTSQQRTILEMSQKMDKLNQGGFYNYFGSITVKNNATVHLAITDIFREEVPTISNITNLQVYIVYNPLTLETIGKMRKRGGNALGIEAGNGALTIVNINLHWSLSDDTHRMRTFMKNVISRFRNKAKEMGMLHRYIFQNHAFEEQNVFAGYGKRNLRRLHEIRREVDPEKVFQRLQPGYFKLGTDMEHQTRDRSEL